MDAGTIVTPIVDKVVESLWETTRRQFGYLIHYHSNIENLRNQVQKLEARRKDVQGLIDAAKRNGEDILNVVKNWIEQVEGIMVEATRILEEDRVNANKRGFLGCFPNLNSRRQLIKEAKMKTDTIKELEQEPNTFHSISSPAPSRGIDSMPSKDFVAFETTKLAMAKVMEALKEDKINFIGIHGMGGVGKTTLVTEIGKKAKEDKLFDNVVFAVVSQTVDLRKIQDQIAGMLDLKLKEQSDLERAAQLHARLKKENRILVILDDVWKRFDVKDVGIPVGVDHDGCKIVITTRRRQVCTTMGMDSETTKIIQLDVLSEEESWDLFRRNAGNFINSPTLMDVAKEVVRECRGLPVALVTVGRAMRGKNPEEWKEAVKELKKSKATNIEGVEEEVYRSLKLSYDYVKDEEAKSCFLLCSLFPEDHNIEIECLLRYGMGLRIFKNVDTINEARSRANLMIKNLKESCLLLASDKEGCIKMHDVVRDVAISIGSEKYLVKAGIGLKEWPKEDTLEHYTGISLMYNQIPEYPDAWECPNLQMLLMQNNFYLDQQISEGVFKGMRAIKVLDRSRFRYYSNFKLETSFCYLANLRTLILEGVRLLPTTALGEIKTLEILSFAYCQFLGPLIAIGHLNNLRLLDLRHSSHFSRMRALIPANAISSLSRLEELYLAKEISRWESEGSNKDVPGIAELKSLRRLTVLTIYIKDLSCIPEDFVFPDLEIFKIHIGTYFENFDGVNPNYLGLRGRRSLYFAKALLRRTNRLSLTSLEGLSNALPDSLLDRDSLDVLKTLEVQECDEFEYLISTEEWRIPPQQAQQHQQRGFCDLEKLHLFKLKNFRGICHGVLPCDMTLTKLKELEVVSCSKLLDTFDSLELVLRLQDLEILVVKDCEALEHMFEFKLVNELKHIWKGPTGHVILHNLTEVTVEKCNKLKNLFLPAIARTLQKLETLRVYRCDELEEIVAKEEEGQEEGQEEEQEAVNIMVFPRLRRMFLDSLSNLNGFCTGSFSFEWPTLTRVYVQTCPKLKTFAAAVAAYGTQSTQKLKDSEVQFCPNLSYNFASLDLLQSLANLNIRHCEALEHIFDLEIEGPFHDEKELLASFRYLSLDDLPELKHIWKGPTGHIILHNLTGVTIERCNKLKNLFPPAIARTLEKLETLKVHRCDELEEIVAKEEDELRLLDLRELKHIWKGPTGQVILHNLKEVDINICDKLKTLFPPAIARTLERLETLKVYRCDELEEIVAKEDAQKEGEGSVNKMVFPRLKILDLFKLPNLSGFCTGSFSFEWPSLERVKVWSCPKLKTFAAADGTQSTPKLKDSEFQFCPKLSNTFASPELLQRLQKLDIEFCEALEHVFDLEIEGPLHYEKELLANLRELTLAHLRELKHIWKGPTGQVILHNLKEVVIYQCDKLKNLFPPAIARKLEQLEHLRVSRCDELEEIVAKEEEGQEEGEEAAKKMTFLRLKTLTLVNLPNLNGFCMGSFSIECPSLEQVEVTDCPKMKTFTASVAADGTLSTPKLKRIKVGYVYIDGPDINMALQKRFKEKEAQPAVKMEPRDDPQSSVQGSA